MPFRDVRTLKRFKDILSKHYLIRSNTMDNRRTFLNECNAEHLIDRIRLDDPTPPFVSNLTYKLRNRKDLFARFIEAFWVLYEDDYEKDDIEFVKSIGNSISLKKTDAMQPDIENGVRAVFPGIGKAVPIKVFISYAKEDWHHAVRLYRDLKSRGIKAWIDREDIVPGQRWKNAIRKAIVGCDYFIALLSNRSITKRGFVHTELKYAIEVLECLPRQEIFVIPTLLEKCGVEDEMLKQLHWAYLYPSYKKGFDDIMQALTQPKIGESPQERKPEAAVSRLEAGKIHVFSNSEFLATIRRVLAGEHIGDQLLENLALFCLRAGVNPEWLEKVALTDEETPVFYCGLIRKALPEDLPLLWSRLADVCEKSRLVPDFEAPTVVQYATKDKDPRICTAAARILPGFRLDRDQLQRLRTWIDPDAPHDGKNKIAAAEHPQARGLGKAMEAVLTAMVLSGEDITDCFDGYGSTILSETFWWRTYYETLIRFMKSGHLPKLKVQERLEFGLGWGMEDPEQLGAIAEVLVHIGTIEDIGLSVYQKALATIRARRSAAWDIYILEICEQVLKAIPRLVFIYLSPFFPELVITDRKMKVAWILGMSAQESSEWLDLLARFMRESDPLQKAFLYQALVDSPADIQDLDAANDALTGKDPVDLAHAAAALAIHHPPAIQKFLAITDLGDC